MKGKVLILKTRILARAFTLVELIVAISIIAVMIAMLIPAVSRARGAAQAVVCASNERQLAIALNGYLISYKQAYPYAQNLRANHNTSGNWPCWATLMSPYMGDFKWFTTVPGLLCPSSPFTPYTTIDFPTATNYALSMAFPLAPSTDPSPTFDANWNINNPVMPMHEWQIKQPSNVLLAGEVVNATAPFPYWNVSVRCWQINDVFFASSNASYWREEKVAVGWHNSSVWLTHDSGWNSLYADGHVTRHSKTSLMRTYLDVGQPGKPGSIFWKNL